MATSDEVEEREREALLWLGANVRHHRQRLGLTQAQLAVEVGVSVVTVRVIERGTHRPSFRLLVGLSVGLDVTSQELLRPRATVQRRPGRPPGR